MTKREKKNVHYNVHKRTIAQSAIKKYPPTSDSMPHGKINPFTITQKINGTDAYLACLALIESLKLIIFRFFLKKKQKAYCRVRL